MAVTRLAEYRNKRHLRHGKSYKPCRGNTPLAIFGQRSIRPGAIRAGAAQANGRSSNGASGSQPSTKIGPNACPDTMPISENYGNWEVFSVFGERFCTTHRTTEFLAEMKPSQMSPLDFKFPKAHARLHDKCSKLKDKSPVQNPYTKKYYAECDSSLWARVDTPVEEHYDGGAASFTIRWKLIWTLRRHSHARLTERSGCEN